MCFVVAGAASGAIEATEHVGVAQLAPVDLQWSAFGSLSAVRSFGRVTATVVATIVWTLLGPEWGLLWPPPDARCRPHLSVTGSQKAGSAGESRHDR